jgi:hypothetical protein
MPRKRLKTENEKNDWTCVTDDDDSLANSLLEYRLRNPGTIIPSDLEDRLSFVHLYESFLSAATRGLFETERYRREVAQQYTKFVSDAVLMCDIMTESGWSGDPDWKPPNKDCRLLLRRLISSVSLKRHTSVLAMTVCLKSDPSSRDRLSRAVGLIDKWVGENMIFKLDLIAITALNIID